MVSSALLVDHVLTGGGVDRVGRGQHRFLTLLSVFGQLAQLVAAGKLTAESQTDDVDGWWFGSSASSPAAHPGTGCGSCSH